VSEIGARIISLRDRQRGREWLLGGTPPSEREAMGWGAESAEFSGPRSFGWDECLPTVAPCPDPRDDAAPILRDHGDQWGRGAILRLDEGRGAMTHTWSAPRWPYRLSRQLSCPDDRTVLAEYTLRSLADDVLPFQWSAHPVLGLEPGCRIELPGVERVTRTWQHGIELPAEADWPLAAAGAGDEVDLSVVRSGAGWATNVYGRPSGPASVTTPDGASLTIDWDRTTAPALRVWLAYGAWPLDGPPVEQVALEPTTSEDDDLGAALAGGRARRLAPGETTTWWMSLRMEDDGA
jgi:hypothetical protein